MPSCAACAHEVAPGDITCSECGATLSVVPPKSVRPAKKVPFDELLLRGVAVVLILLVLLALGFVGWSIASRGISSGAP